jgi:hypothetical protein
MRQELFHARYIEVCQARCQGRRESSARLNLNADGRNPHISFQFMVTIQVVTIGEVRVSLNRSLARRCDLGAFFQLAQSQGSVDTDDKMGAAQSRPRKEYFAVRTTAKLKSNRRQNKEIVERVVACRRARRLWSERCSKWLAGRMRGGGRWQNGRISVVQSRLPAQRKKKIKGTKKDENDARLVYSDNSPL